MTDYRGKLPGQEKTRFFFDLVWNGRSTRDETGLDLRQGLGVRDAAIYAAVEHAIDLSADQSGLHEVRVRNVDGDVVLTVSLRYETCPPASDTPAQRAGQG